MLKLSWQPALTRHREDEAKGGRKRKWRELVKERSYLSDMLPFHFQVFSVVRDVSSLGPAVLSVLLHSFLSLILFFTAAVVVVVAAVVTCLIVLFWFTVSWLSSFTPLYNLAQVLCHSLVKLMINLQPSFFSYSP